MYWFTDLDFSTSLSRARTTLRFRTYLSSTSKRPSFEYHSSQTPGVGRYHNSLRPVDVTSLRRLQLCLSFDLCLDEEKLTEKIINKTDISDK